MKQKMIKFAIVGALLVVLGILLASCTPAPTPCPECPAVPVCPEAAACPSPEAGVQAPFEALWAGSAHADAKAEAFVHWNEADPAEVPVSCAKCHSGDGFQDYVGADGSEALKVDKAAPIGTVIGCSSCHNDATKAMTSVVFPQIVDVKDKDGNVTGTENVVISGLGSEAVCMNCHQGRESSSSVDAAIAKAFEDAKIAEVDVDTVPVGKDDSGKDKNMLGFKNVHYASAAATLEGTRVKGGYEYAGQAYDWSIAHEPEYNSCNECHDTHSLQLKVEQCAECHDGVTKAEDLRNVRMLGSLEDYDGDGDTKEGIYYEIAGLQEALYSSIQAYAKDVLKKGVIYDGLTYPYFLLDADGNGEADKNDKDAVIAFSDWTPRLLKAAYNYQFSMKDGGGYAHGGKYIIELLYDSVTNLNEKLVTPVDISAMHRLDAGHFASSQEAWRHWDDEGEVVGGCARCHSAEGVPLIVANANLAALTSTMTGSYILPSQELSSGMYCGTCHDPAKWATGPGPYDFNEVLFPSGVKLSFAKDDKGVNITHNANVCMVCHQGRESNVSVNAALKAFPDQDAPSDKIRFRNIHYFAAATSLFGSEANGLYQFEGKEYAGRFAHTQNFDTCVACHDVHKLEPKVEACKGCHQTDDPTAIRMNLKEDYDGDGNISEGLKGEVDGMAEQLYAAIQKYAKDVTKTPIFYDPNRNPYFFADANDNGKIDSDEKAYTAFSPRLLKAAFNYQAVIKDPGIYVHNAKYALQIMFDTIEDLGSKPAGVRP